jgi:prophage antirepressor-like protein
VIVDGDPWFVAVDVCHCLGLYIPAGSFTHTKHLRSTEKWLLRKKDAIAHPVLDTGSVGQLFGPNTAAVSLISESGLYKLIMRSDKPIAATFQDWVTREVLPSIRKTGAPAPRFSTLARSADC